MLGVEGILPATLTHSKDCSEKEIESVLSPVTLNPAKTQGSGGPLLLPGPFPDPLLCTVHTVLPTSLLRTTEGLARLPPTHSPANTDLSDTASYPP